MKTRNDRLIATLAAGFLLPVVTMVDWFTGANYNFSIFYALPLTLLVWYRGKMIGLAAIVYSELAWLIDYLMNRPGPLDYSRMVWLLLVRLAYFLALTYLLDGLRHATDRLRAAERDRAEAMAAQAAAEREKSEAELAAAHRIQRGFFPSSVPQDCGLEVYGICVPMSAVGGDYYDWFAAGGCRTALAAGDVVGHGLPAALLMAALSGAVRGRLALWENGGMAELAGAVNAQLLSVAGPGDFATLVLLHFDPSDGLLSWANAGHNPPLLLRAADGSFEELKTTGPLTGVIAGAKYREDRTYLKKGDLLVIYTDGITETFSPGGEQFGPARLRQTVGRSSALPVKELADRILAETAAWRNGAPQDDDQTLVVARVH